MAAYNFPTYDMGSEAGLSATKDLASGAGTAGAAASGINWGQVGATAGASALSGILTAMYQREQERQKKIENAQKAMSDTAGQYGQNQNNILGQMMNNWAQALGK